MNFSDADIDNIETQTHVHSYSESWQSKYTDSTGRQVRKFVCDGCGKTREVRIPISAKNSQL